MLSNQDTWNLACALARSGEYANVVMIERELRRRGVLKDGPLTTQSFRRELLTRVCHAARRGDIEAEPLQSERPAFGLGRLNLALDLP